MVACTLLMSARKMARPLGEESIGVPPHKHRIRLPTRGLLIGSNTTTRMRTQWCRAAVTLMAETTHPPGELDSINFDIYEIFPMTIVLFTSSFFISKKSREILLLSID
jgi:hypothetical protein